MKPIWISSTKAAELLGISDRQVRRSVSMWNYRWSEKDGRKVYTTDVVADRVEFLDRGDRAEGGSQSSMGYSAPAPEKASGPAIPEGFSQLTDDDIPF